MEKKMKAVKLKEIATLVQGKLCGDGEAEVQGVSDIEHAGPGTMTFFSNKKYFDLFKKTPASGVFVPQEAEPLLGDFVGKINMIFVPNPVLAFAKTAMGFIEAPILQKGIDQRAAIAPTAQVDATAVIYPFATIGEHSVIGPNTVIYSGVSIGNKVRVGRDCVFHPQATIHDGTEIGDRVVIKAGAVVGSEGFGFTPDEENGGIPFKVPQVGNVRLDNDVEIGSNSTIDRATMGTTIIGKGTKIDNLVHVAHNCVIGENTIICAQCGISGSTTIGNRVIFAGHVGTKGHVKIGDNVVVAAQSGISKDIAPNQTVKGYPPRPLKEYLKLQAVVQNLPELRERLLKLEKEVAALSESDYQPEANA